jgi:photosystem II stability/assembly factor-like uncharacterized protein
VTTPAVPTPVSYSPRTASLGAIVDLDVVDASTSWVLLTTCIQPMTGQCHYLVTRTTDGGATWSKPVRVGPGFNPADGGAPRHVLFLNSQDGFVYGSSDAYITHDGGRTWISTGFNAVFFVAATGRASRAWAITYPCAKGVSCADEVQTSTDAGRTWSAPHAMQVDFDPSDGIAFSNNGLLIEGAGSDDMVLTLDGGTTWSFIKTRCTASTFIANVATSDGNELWQLCVEHPSANAANVSDRVLFVSEDGGKSWTQRATLQISNQLAASGYLLVLVSTRPGAALMATNQSTMTISHDGGRTWASVNGPAGVGFMTIRFANGFDGWALDVNQNIWFTHDGGDSWKELPGISIPPAS